MHLAFTTFWISVSTEYHSTFSITDPSPLRLQAIESQLSEFVTVRCFVECQSSVLSPTHNRYLFTHKQTHRDALPQSLDLVCIQMEKMYPADAVGPEIESCCLLFQNILKRTKEGTKEEQTASKSLASVSKVNAPHCSPSLLPTNP